MNRRLFFDADTARPDARRPTRPGLRPCSPAAALLGQAAAVALLLTVLSSADRAHAACDPDPPSDDDAVVCTGTDETGFDGTGATNLTITTSGVVAMDDSSALDAAIAIGDANDVSLGVGATVTVTEANGAGVRGGDENFVTNEGRILVDGASGVAIDVGSVALVPNPLFDAVTNPDVDEFIDPTPIPTITQDGVIELRGANSVGIRSVDNYNIVTNAGSTITLETTATGGVAIDGANDNVVDHNGTITIRAANAWGVRLLENTGLPGSNGGIFGAASQTTVIGDDSVALQVDNNTGTAVSGTIDLLGDGTVGVRALDKAMTLGIGANHTNAGTINILGNDAIGLDMGDLWLDLNDDDEPTGGGIRNRGTINVSGARSIGVRAGNIGNASGNNNSYVDHSGDMDVTGTDAIGFSLGGNDELARFDFDDTDSNTQQFGLFSTGTITGGPNAGPLVLFRTGVGGGENRLVNQGEISADLAGVAVQGTDGDEIIFNFGTMRGDIDLQDGDDRYAILGDSVYEGGTVDGGDGTDEIALLGVTDSTVGVFDPTGFVDFERVRVGGRNSADESIGWRIDDAAFAVPVFVIDGGRLSAPANPDNTTAPVRFDAPLTIDAGGSVFVAPDGTTTPIVVTDSATFDGEVVVAPTSLLTSTGTYRLIEATGGISGSRFATETIAATTGLLMFALDYDTTGLDLVVTGDDTFAGVAMGANRRAIARFIDALEADGSTPTELADWIADLRVSTDDLNPAYDALSPEAYDAQTAVIAESSRRITSLLFDRPRDCVDGELDRWNASSEALDCHAGRLSAWATGLGTIRERDAHAEHIEYDAEMGGLVLGVDLAPVGNVDVTLAIAAQRGQIDVANVGESDLVLANLMAQASWQNGPIRVQGAATYGYGAHSDKRSIFIDESATVIDRNADEDHASHHVGLSGQASFLFEAGPIGVEPLVGVDYVFITQDDISESGAGGFGLDIDEREDSILFGTAGLRLSTVYRHDAYIADRLIWMDGIWRPTLDVRWRQTLVGAEREIEARLAGAPDTVGSFTIEGEEDAGGFEVGVGLTFIPKLANRLQFDVRYDLFKGPETLEHDLVAKLRFGF